MSPSLSALLLAAAGAAPIEPPWHPPPPGILNFTVPGVENVPDLHGDPANPDLTLLLAGNQFMVLPELLAAFQKRHPMVRQIFYETLPPGVVAEQLENGGALVLGNLVLHVRADVFAAGPGRMEKLRAEGRVGTATPYASNDLVIAVRKGNPRGIHGLADLAQPGLRLSLPNPQTEGIGRHIEKALERAGGAALRERVMVVKVKDKTTVLTRVHHRETPVSLLTGKADAGVVWRTEVLFQRQIGHDLEAIEIPPAQNHVGSYEAAVVTNAPHPQSAADFVQFLVGDEGQAILRRYGFAAARSSGDGAGR